jgi:hypothetical protein
MVKIVSIVAGTFILGYLAWWGFNAFSSLGDVLDKEAKEVDTLKQVRHYHPEQL